MAMHTNTHFFSIHYYFFSLPTICSDESEGEWCWNYMGEEFWIKRGSEIRFRVTEVRYNFKDSKPTPPKCNEHGEQFIEAPKPLSLIEQPMLVIGSIAESGLGLLSWWRKDE